MNPTPIIRALLDTCVVVDYRDGWPNPIELFTAIRATRFPEFSEITTLALFARCQDTNDLLGVQVFLMISDVYPATRKIMRLAQRILETLPPPCGLTAEDAIVAATAIEHKLPLYTLTLDRFAAVPGLNALQPY